MESAKCEFCDKLLKSDFDVARHLTDAEHREKLNLYRENLKQSHANFRVMRRNFREILQLVKVRNETEIDTLANRGFFKVDTDSMANVAESLAQVLLKSLVEYKLSDFDPAAREVLMAALSGESAFDSQLNSESDGDCSVSACADSHDNPDTTSGTNRSIQGTKYHEYMPTHAPQQPEPSMVKTEYEPLPSVQERELTSEPPTVSTNRKQKGSSPESSGPRPDPTSTYTPQLAKIKVEPKDD